MVILISILRFEELSKSLSKTNLYWVCLGILFYYLNYFFRAKRVISLSGKNIYFLPQAIYISSIHGMVSYFLPLRSGDLFLPVMLKSVASIELVQGGKILIKAILLDISILGFFTCCAAISYPYNHMFLKFIWITIGMLMIFAFIITQKLVMIIPSYFPKLPDFVYSLCKIDEIKLNEIIDTFIIWSCIGLSLFAAAKAVGLDLSFSETWILVTIQLPLQLFPVQGIANTGNHEIGWVAGLVLLGIDADNAFNYALTSHAVLIIYVFALVVPGLLSFRYLIQKGKTNVYK